LLANLLLLSRPQDDITVLMGKLSDAFPAHPLLLSIHHARAAFTTAEF
jgi:hypothetical protein